MLGHLKKVLHKSLKRSRARKIFCTNLDPLKIAIARVGAASSTEVSRGKVRLWNGRSSLAARKKEGRVGRMFEEVVGAVQMF